MLEGRHDGPSARDDMTGYKAGLVGNVNSHGVSASRPNDLLRQLDKLHIEGSLLVIVFQHEGAHPS